MPLKFFIIMVSRPGARPKQASDNSPFTNHRPFTNHPHLLDAENMWFEGGKWRLHELGVSNLLPFTAELRSGVILRWFQDTILNQRNSVNLIWGLLSVPATYLLMHAAGLHASHAVHLSHGAHDPILSFLEGSTCDHATWHEEDCCHRCQSQKSGCGQQSRIQWGCKASSGCSVARLYCQLVFLGPA